MVGEGIGSVFSAAFGYVPTLFSYFNPSRSPYYAMTVACIVALCVLFFLGQSAWIAAYIPVSLVLVILAIVTLRAPRYLFSIDEYNDQLKFARSLAVTTAVVCIVFLVHSPRNPLGYGPIDGGATRSPGATNSDGGDPYLGPTILGIYLFCLAQILLFLAYMFVFANYKEAVRSRANENGENQQDPALQPPEIAERNYVQIALVMCAYLAGMTVVANRVEHTFTFEILTLLLFGSVWLACAVQVILFVARNFSLQPPHDIVLPLRPPAANVITFKQLRSGSAAAAAGQEQVDAQREAVP